MTTFQNLLVSIAKAEVGVIEIPKNSNRGPKVDQYKGATWLPAAQAWPWCAAFVCWCIREAMRVGGVKETHGFKRPRTAGAWDFINWSLEQDNSTRTVRSPKAKDIAAGDIVVYTFSHIGIAIQSCDPYGRFQAVEGNTDEAGSREGGGVYLKARSISQVKARIRFTI